MAWPAPHLPNQVRAQWTTGMVNMPIQDMNINSGPYTPEQWAMMQQQNWQTWTQWQQQYSQWQNQYGDKYAQQLQAVQSMGGVPPPPPSGAVPPPPPDKPPPPPPHENNQPLFNSNKDTSSSVSAPLPQQRNNSNYSTSNTGTGKTQWSYNTDAPPQPAANTEALKKLAEEERLFDIQFQKWEEEIEKWRQENVNHPDKQAYRDYEAKFEACRKQLLERRQQMKLKRANLLNIPTQTNNTGNTPVAPPSKNSNQNSCSQKELSQGMQNKSYDRQLDTSKSLMSNNITIKPQDNYESYPKNKSAGNNQSQNESDGKNHPQVNYSQGNKSDNSSFLPSTSSSSKGIPGLDLVPEPHVNEKQADIIDITDDQTDSLQQASPDYSNISIGINNILGDEKIMNILSMVSGFKPHDKFSDSIPPSNQGNRNQNYNQSQQYGDRQNNMNSRQGQYAMQQNQDSQYPARMQIGKQEAMRQEQYYDQNAQHGGIDMRGGSQSRGPQMGPGMGPSMGQGMRPGVPRQGGPGMNQGGPGMNQGGPGLNQGGPVMNLGKPGMNQGGPGMNQGGPRMNHGGPGMNQGGPGMNHSRPGMNQGGPGMDQGGPGMRPSGPGRNQGGPGLRPSGLGMYQGGRGMRPTGPGMIQSGPGMRPSGPGADQGGPGMNQGGSGMNQGGSGMNQGGPGMNQGGPGMNQGGPGMNQGGPGMNQGGSGMSQGGPGMNQGGSGMSQGGPGMNKGGSGMSQGGPGMNQGGPGIRPNVLGLDQGGPGMRASGPGLNQSGPGPNQIAPGPNQSGPGMRPGGPNMQQPPPLMQNMQNRSMPMQSNNVSGIPSLLDVPVQQNADYYGTQRPMPPTPQPKSQWVEEPMFTPSIVVEYEHKSLRLKAQNFIEPVHTFDYNHVSKDSENKKKDFEHEVEELFTRKPRWSERDYGDDRFDKGELYQRDYDRRGLRDEMYMRDNRDTRELKDKREPRDIRESRDMRETRDMRDMRDTRDTRDMREPRDLRESRDFRDTRQLRDREPRDLREPREIREPRDMREPWDIREPRDMREPRDFRDSRGRDDMNKDRPRDDHFERRRDDDRRREDRDRDRFSRRDDHRDRDRENRNRDGRRDDIRDSRRDDKTRSISKDRDSRKRGLSRDSEVSNNSKKSKDAPQNKPLVMIDDLLEQPGRDMRPEKIVIIIRGIPGSGKSYLAKLIRDREAEHGGTARIMSIDDYFMQEGEIEETDPATGKTVKKPSLKYEYDASLEETYINSLKRAFKRSITDGYFSFLIFDAVNINLPSYADIWNFARQNGFQVYICSMEVDVQTAFKRNIHNRSIEDIEVLASRFFPTPAHHIQLDATTLLQNAAITEVQMEDVSDDVVMEDMPEEEVESVFTSKWEKMDDANKLARLDGISKPLRPSQLSMEDYLQLDDWTPNKAQPGKKTVRWADIEERRQQEKMRAIGFVVGQTDWNRMTDPTQGSSALTQTKYIERVRRN